MAEDVSWGTGSGDLLSSPKKPRRLRTCQKYLQDAIVRKACTVRINIACMCATEPNAKLVSSPSLHREWGWVAPLSIGALTKVVDGAFAAVGR